MEYHLKCIDPADFPAIYPRLERDFPRTELKRLPHMQRLLDEGLEVGWTLMADGRDAGYAFVIQSPALPFVLLDYLAMEERGHGAGSVCLALLKNEYPQGILAEVEDVLPELDADTNALRRRRWQFYRRAGFVPVPFENVIFTERYLVHLWTPAPVEQPRLAAARTLDAYYALQLPEERYRENVFITEPEGE